MNLLKLPVGEKWFTSELKAHRLVLHRTTLGVDTVMVWPEYVAGKGFNETASALIGELYRFSTGAGHWLHSGAGFTALPGACSLKVIRIIFVTQQHGRWTGLCKMLTTIMA